MYLDKEKILTSLTSEDIIKVCVELGSDYPKPDGQGNYIFQTNICHGGDSWKLYFYEDNHMFHCYTCGDSFGLIELVIRANKQKGIKMTWYNALKYIGVLTGKLATINKDIKQKQSNIITDWQWINQIKNKKPIRKIPELTPYNEHYLELFDYEEPIIEWLNEGISDDIIKTFEIGFSYEQNCITIPVRDIEGRLVGIRARYLLEEDIENGKYRPIVIQGDACKYNTGLTFYGIYQNQETIAKYKKCFLFESEKSVLLNHTFYGDKDLSLAVCGSNITSTQIKILVKTLGVSHIVICFDKEYDKSDSYEAEIYYNKLLKKVEPLLKFCTVELVMDRQDLLDKKDSPVDKGFEVWNKLLDDKILVTDSDIKNLKQ